MTFKPQFTRRIDLGHIIQAGIMLISVGGCAGTVFWMLQSQITTLALAETRVEQQGRQHDSAIKQLQDDNRHLSETIGAALSKLGDQLSDLRVLVAKEGRSGR